MSFEILYRPEVHDDLDEVPGNIEPRIKKAVEERLMTHPRQYGQRLRQSLHNLWRLCTGDYRIVYAIDEEKSEVTIWGIRHRKDIYEEIEKRKNDDT